MANKNFEVKHGLSVGGTERISTAGVITGSLASATTATTQSALDNSTKIATTAYTDAAITALIGGAPSALNDLNELAAAIASDANYSTTITTALATKLPLAGGTLTGTLNVTGDGEDVIINSADYELMLLGNRGASGSNLDQAYLRMKSEGTNTIILDTNGATFFNGGNVGIKMANTNDLPQQTLHVGGSGASIYLGNNTADTNFIHTGGCLSLTSDTDVYITCDSNDVSSAIPPSGVIVFGGGSSTDTDTNHNFTEAEFGNNGAGRVEYGRFHSNGFFGLNQNNPSELLDVQGDIKVGTGFKIGSGVLSGALGFNRNPDDGATYTSSLQRFQINGPFTNNDFWELQNYESGGGFVGSVKVYADGNSSNRHQHVLIRSNDSATLTINADTNNSGEDGIPTLDFKMDGTVTRLKVGVGDDNLPYISTQSDIALPLIIKTGTAGNNRVYINDTGMQISDGTAVAPDHIFQLVHEGTPINDRTFISIKNGTNVGDTSVAESHIDFEFFDANSNEYPQARISSGPGHYPNQDANSQLLEGSGYIALCTNTASTANTTEVDPAPALVARGDGGVQVAYDGTNDRSGYFYAGKDWGATNHRINRNLTQGSNVLVVSAYGGSGIGADTALFFACAAGGRNSAGTGMAVEKNSSTSRSINAAGTINASGSDYAEYVKKSDACGTIAKGDICGIDVNSKLTDKWSEAHSFVVKSTDPSYVGGDTWGTLEKPELTRRGYADPENPGPETEEEYTARVAQYETDLAAFEIALEAKRVKYDRIAFSGQVPCNLIGANVGDYIIPKEGISDAITGEAVSSPTFEQYQKAVGKVWKVLDNGNAWISVKIG